MNFDRQNHSDRMTDTVALPASADGGEGFTFNLPAIITDTHHEAGERFMEFFAATIRNRNTRAAYGRAVSSFLSWEGVSGLASLRDVRPLHVAAYIEECCDQVSAPTVKLRLAALRGLFDWLVRSGVMDGNPAHAVRGPTHEVVRGKTPILSASETRRLLESIPTDTVVQLRDRALIALMTYSFARVSAAVGMDVEDLVQTAGRSWVRLREKRGKVHELPIHHKLLDHLDAYLDLAGHRDQAKAPLFQSSRGRSGALTGQRFSRHDAYSMIRRRAVTAGIVARIGNHSFRGTGITTFLLNEGSLEMAQEMANHSSPRTTKLYDRRNDRITQDAIERIRIE
ncbi:tyrosine-type recombinase/integrase [Brevundimonas sp.]|uniref:tyrosine-type recombinase/integrase n=1 Tax=Brevundimonas sp. TaxID=1871086 RepID=UPI0035660205